MRTRKFLLNVDLVIQTLLLFLAVASVFGTLASKGAFGIILGYVLFFLGAWQMGSGAIIGILLRDRKRAEYFFGSIVYLISIGVLGNLNPISIGEINMVLAFIFIAAIPLWIAYWYWKLTKDIIEKLEIEVEIPEEMRDVLDSEEIFRPIEN